MNWHGMDVTMKKERRTNLKDFFKDFYTNIVHLDITVWEDFDILHNFAFYFDLLRRE